MKANSKQLLLAFDAEASSEAFRDDLTGYVRRVACGTGIISYQLQRVRRRSIGLQVNEAGLTVRAPRWITLREIEATIIANQRWIDRKRAEWSAQRTAICLADGGVLQYLGNPVTLRLGAGATHFDSEVDEIRLAVPAQTSESEIRRTLQHWLRQQAQVIFGERIECFADRIDTRFAGWRLSSARTQWGSCSPGGRVRLNWRLVHFSLPVIDYVIAHELAHLTELNHSPRFWSAVARLVPGFEAARDQIKRIELSAISF